MAELRAGRCVGLPTETVYGLAADGLNPEAVARIFEIKQRPHFDPLILHVAEPEGLEALAAEVPATARALADAFWPGPLTLVLPRRPVVPDLVTSGLETVAVRCPAHPVARALLRAFGGPLAAPSANPFGRLSPTTAAAVEEELGAAVAVVLDGGACGLGIESTIVDCTGPRPCLLRHGALPREVLETVCGPVDVAVSGEKLRAPGMLQSHYAPRTPLRLLEGPVEAEMDWPAETAHLSWRGPLHPKACAGEVLSARGDLQEAAARLFAALRRLDRSGARAIQAERVPEEGLGRAVNDRLGKGAALPEQEA